MESALDYVIIDWRSVARARESDSTPIAEAPFTTDHKKRSASLWTWRESKAGTMQSVLVVAGP